MTVAEVEAIRSRSKAGRSGPWVSDWAEMAKKTAVRRLVKLLPLSIEDEAAIKRIDALEFEDRRERRAAAVVDVEQVYSLTPDADDSPEVATVDDYETMPVGDV